jgi:tetratricopeptide (TPR) repeat protein
LPVFTAAKAAKASSPTIEVLIQLHGGQSASQLKKWPEAIAWLEPILKQQPETPYLAEILYELGWAKQNAGKDQEAEADYLQAATKSPRGEVGARAGFMIGELYFNRKEYDAAIRQFQRVMYGFGGADALPEVKKWQAKAGYEAGRCGEVQIKDAKPADRVKLLADAKTAYTYVVEKHPEDALAGESRKRLEALAKL